jgi:probable HAF family extracellular repeat protein
MRPAKISTAATVILVVAAWQSQALAISYRFTDLGPLAGNRVGRGADVNELGEVAGRAGLGAFSKAGPSRAGLYRGSFTDLGNLPGRANDYANAVNDHGVVVGGSGEAYPLHPEGDLQINDLRAFIYDCGTMRALSGLDGFRSEALDINNSGQIVGWFATHDFSLVHAFRHDGTTLQDLAPLLGDRSTARGINDLGQITGSAQFGTHPGRHAFVLDGTTVHDLGTLGGMYSAGWAINVHGHVTGDSATLVSGPFIRRAFFHDGTTMHDLGTLGGAQSFGFGINSHVHIVGESETASGSNRAFLYTPATGMVDLNSLVDLPEGWVLVSALDINDAGQITGYGGLGNEQPFLLTPVPEPSTFVLALVVAVSWITGRRRGGAKNRGNFLRCQRTLRFDFLLGFCRSRWYLRSTLCLAAAVMLSVIAACQSQALASSFRLIELPPLGTDVASAGFSINERGDVAGISSEFPLFNVESSAKGGPWRGALYRGGTATPLTGLPTNQLYRNVAYGLNDHGVVVGRLGGLSGNSRAFLDDGTFAQELSGFAGYTSEARAINNLGHVVGAYNSGVGSVGTGRAFLHDGATWHDLGTLGRASRAYDINDLGLVTGSSEISLGIWRAFLHDGTTLHDLGALGGSDSVGFGISPVGHVTGYVQTGPLNSYGAIHAFLYDGSAMHDLGSLGGRFTVGNAVNSHGHVVGHVPKSLDDIHSREGDIAFLYTPANGMVALSSVVNMPPGWTQLNSARDINDDGQITGYGQKSGVVRGFFLTPVPEPSTIFLVVVLAVGCITCRRRGGAEQLAKSIDYFVDLQASTPNLGFIANGAELAGVPQGGCYRYQQSMDEQALDANRNNERSRQDGIYFSRSALQVVPAVLVGGIGTKIFARLGAAGWVSIRAA